jgi:hypothetical protein
MKKQRHSSLLLRRGHGSGGKFRSAALALALLCFSPLQSRATGGEGTTGDALEQGRLLFYRSVNDESALQPAEAAFRSLDGYPAEADGYLAALETLKGKHALYPWEKLRLTKEGLKELDGAVQRHPENFEVRFLRAATLSYIPSFFGYRNTLTQDVHFLAQSYPLTANQLPLKRRVDIGRFLLGRSELQPRDRSAVAEIVRRAREEG